MNEAERCDRMSMMHAGKVLAQGPPAQLVAERKAKNLEEAFIGYLEEAGRRRQERARRRDGATARAQLHPCRSPGPGEPHREKRASKFSLGRIWAFARREAVELQHDRVRVAFAVFGPILLMIVFGYGISLDVDHLPFAVLDSDGTPASRLYAGYLPRLATTSRSSRRCTATMSSTGACETVSCVSRWRFPPGFENDLQRGRQPEVNATSMPPCPSAPRPPAATWRASITLYENGLRDQKGIPRSPNPINFETRALFNQAFKSIYAMVPGDIMLLLILIPSMLTALSVVREKEFGSIANFYAAPATRLEFLFGKQLPYVGCRAHSVRDPGCARGVPVSGTLQGQLGDSASAASSMFWRAPALAC